jgi:uncharacterized Tic20 family protein
MSEGRAGNPSPGWYDDPGGAVRFWDGERWEDSGAPPGAGPAQPYGNAYGNPYAPPPGQQGYPAAYPPPYGGGPYPPAAPSDGRTMAMFAHLGVFVGGFLVPLIIYATVGKTDPFVRRHAAEALNFSLAYMLVSFIGMIIGFVTLFIGFIVILPLMLVAAVVHIVFAVQGAMKASAGEWYRYPVSIRFVSDTL